MPELYVLPCEGEPRHFYVAGAIHAEEQCWYHVFIGDETHLPRCECQDHFWRKLGTSIPCKHLAAVHAFIERGRLAASQAGVQWFLSLSEEERKAIFR